MVKTYQLCGDCRAAWIKMVDHRDSTWQSRYMSDPDAQALLVQISMDNPGTVRLPDDIDHT